MSALIETYLPKNRRTRVASGDVPTKLRPFSAMELEVLRLWVGEDETHGKHKRESMLKKAKSKVDGFDIEDGDLLVERLLQDGWVISFEMKNDGAWSWTAFSWRDLARLQTLLGATSVLQRQQRRQVLLEDARRRLLARVQSRSPDDADLSFDHDLAQAIEGLEKARALAPEALERRLTLMFAVADWRDNGQQGMRNDFALSVRDGTKAIEAREWRWLEAFFDLEALGISRFSQTAWIAGDITLFWGARKMDVAAVHFLCVPLKDMLTLERIEGVRQWWLIENRTSFERQAQALPSGTALLWMPGRPSFGWLEMVAALLGKAAAPARISADADPAGVDIACTVGAQWEQAGLPWEPYRMGVEELMGTRQFWPLGDKDRQLLPGLLAREGLPVSLRVLCEAMQREGRKAEQEAWL